MSLNTEYLVLRRCHRLTIRVFVQVAEGCQSQVYSTLCLTKTSLNVVQKIVIFNTLMGTGNYSATSKTVDGWAVTFDTARRGLGGAAARPGLSSLYQM